MTCAAAVCRRVRFPDRCRGAAQEFPRHHGHDDPGWNFHGGESEKSGHRYNFTQQALPTVLPSMQEYWPCSLCAVTVSGGLHLAADPPQGSSIKCILVARKDVRFLSMCRAAVELPMAWSPLCPAVLRALCVASSALEVPRVVSSTRPSFSSTPRPMAPTVRAPLNPPPHQCPTMLTAFPVVSLTRHSLSHHPTHVANHALTPGPCQSQCSMSCPVPALIVMTCACWHSLHAHTGIKQWAARHGALETRVPTFRDRANVLLQCWRPMTHSNGWAASCARLPCLALPQSTFRCGVDSSAAPRRASPRRITTLPSTPQQSVRRATTWRLLHS